MILLHWLVHVVLCVRHDNDDRQENKFIDGLHTPFVHQGSSATSAVLCPAAIIIEQVGRVRVRKRSDATTTIRSMSIDLLTNRPLGPVEKVRNKDHGQVST